jgi:hypothetical protein
MSRRHWRRAVVANATGFPPLKKVRRIVVIQLGDAMFLGRLAGHF